MLGHFRVTCIAVVALVLVGLVCPSNGQVGRATITGIISDSTEAAVPSAAVRATNTETNLSYDSVSNESGSYSIVALPVGQYSVTVKASGFKEFVREGLSLSGGQTARIDVALEVGQLAEKMTVTAEATMLQTETAQTVEGVQSRVFSDLPLSFGGGRNMAAFAARLVPGVIGSDWQMKVQGSPAGSQGVVIDGMTNLAGFLPGDFGEASISPEAIQELNVYAGNVSAEHGRESGGTMEFTLKSGTNDLHGTGFYYMHNEFFNANDWNNNRLLAADPNFTSPTTRNFLRPKDRRRDWGFSVGGPVYLPKIYNGRNKSFFYFTLERFKINNVGPNSSPSQNVPQPEMFDGNLSRLLTGRQVGVDALNRPVMEGAIYDPTTLRQVNNQYVADIFPGNIIPASRISKVASNFKPIFSQYYAPVVPNLTQNLYFTNYVDQNVKQLTVKGDHSISPRHKLSGYYYRHNFPRNFQDAGGLWSLSDPTYGGPLARAMRQERRGFNWNVSYDWVLTPAMLNHLSFGINDNKNFYGSRQAGKGYASAWGVTGVGNGLLPDQWSAPEFNLGGSPVATFESWGKRDYRDFDYKGYILNENLSTQIGRHSFKFGMEWNRLKAQDFRWDSSGGIFNFVAVTTGIPGQPYSANIGNSFASFLLGLVNSATTGPPFNTTSRRDYAAVFFQDTWKVTQRLTLNYGLRWSGNTPIYEDQDHIATFDPTVTDPANGLKGAVLYMGSGQGRTGTRSPAPSDWKDFGPTFGFAYRIRNKLVARGGYGITYTPEAMFWNNVPNGFVAGFAPINSIDANTKGQYLPVFNIDGGYPGQLLQPALDPSWGTKHGSTIVSPDYAHAGYVQHFNFGFQYEASKDLLVEADWRGSKGTRLHSGGNFIPNQIHKEELWRGNVLGQVIDSPAKAASANLPYPFAGFSGLGANTLQPFPQITTFGLTAWGDPIGFTTYHSANLVVTKRMSKGVHAYAAYEFSKIIANVNDVAGGNTTGIQDTYNRQIYKSISPDDRTHRLKSSLIWDLPMGKGRAVLGSAGRLANAIVGGWTVSAILNYTSGAPMGAPSSRVRPVGWNGPAVYANFTGPSGKFVSSFDPANFNPWNRADPGNRVFNPAYFSDALPQDLGNSPVRFATLRSPWNFSEDGSILKRFRVRERFSMQLRLELLNMFNRHYFGSIDTNMNNASFGSIWTASGGRTAQLGARAEW